MTVVIGKDGRELELDDDAEVPSGATLRVPPSFMDSGEAFHLDADAIEELRARCADDSDEDDGEQSDDDGEEHDDEDELTPAARAYLASKMALDYRQRRKKVTAPVPTTPSWQRSPWKPRKGKIEMGGAPDSVPDAKDAAEKAEAAARKSYEARNRYLNDAWRRRAGKPPQHSPSVTYSKPTVSASWASGDRVPAVGGSGRSPYRDQRLSDGEAAYRRMVDDLSNRWKSHRKPHVFTPEAGT